MRTYWYVNSSDRCFMDLWLTHAGIIMFEQMSAKWAMAVLGFISFGLVALVYVLYFFGATLRAMSKLAK